MGNYRDNLVAAMVVFLVINTAAIAARLYVRVKLLTRAIGMDDLMLCLVFVSSTVALAPFAYRRGFATLQRASSSKHILLTSNLQTGYVVHCGLESASMYWGYAAPAGEKHPRYDNAKATEVSSSDLIIRTLCSRFILVVTN